MSKGEELATTVNALAVPDRAYMAAEFKKLREFQIMVQKEMRLGLDYGVQPGAHKPSLWKPGAEKLIKMHGLIAKYEILNEIEDWDKPLFRFKFRCELRNMAGLYAGEGFGECNSMETKYRYRWVTEKEVPPAYDISALPMKRWNDRITFRVDNDQIFTLVNTILKIGKKRSLIDATLEACRLSDIFTQDITAEEGEGDSAPKVDDAEVVPGDKDHGITPGAKESGAADEKELKTMWGKAYGKKVNTHVAKWAVEMFPALGKDKSGRVDLSKLTSGQVLQLIKKIEGQGNGGAA